jgi:hypothetical protein
MTHSVAVPASTTASGDGAHLAGVTAGFVLAMLIGLAGARGLFQEIQRARAR